MNQPLEKKVAYTDSIIKDFSESDVKRFWSHVNKNGSIPKHRPELGNCWEWTASKCHNGYGNFSLQTWPIRAHRFSAVLHGKFTHEQPSVIHSCDNPACVNPDHLKCATQKENSHDMIKKNRQANGEKQHLAKLVKEQIAKIRKLRAGGMTLQKISDLFGVDRSNIGYIVNGVTWKHIR